MKKTLLIVIFLLFIVQQNYSQEKINKFSYPYDYYEQFGLRALGDISLRVFFPVDANANRGALTYLGLGFGLGVDIIKYFLSPGIYLGAGLGTDWLTLFSLDKNISVDFGYSQLGVNCDIRIYNIIKLYDFDLIPFFGYHFNMFFRPLPNFGVSLSYKNFAMEYAYYFPVSYEPFGRHHVALKITKNDYWDYFFGFGRRLFPIY